MTNSSEPIRVIFVGDPGPVQQQITTALGSQQEYVLVDILSSMERLFRDIRSSEPQIILVDHLMGNQPTLDIIDDINLQFPESPIVSILPENDPTLIQQVTLAGALAFLVQPFSQINLLSTLRRVRELETRRQKYQTISVATKATQGRALRTLAVFGPRGGVGTSTLATNLAVSILEHSGSRVLLMDGKLFFGHLDVLLNIRARNNIADLVPHAATMDETLVHEIIVEHTLGIHVLLSPVDIQLAQGIRPEDLYNIYTGLQRMYDYVIIDAGNSLTENTVTLMDAADRILVVTAPDLASLHDTSRYVQIGRSLSYPAEKILILLNRIGIPGGIKLRDIESALHHPIYAQIPEDGQNALRSINRGIPLVVRYPRSKTSRAIHELAKKLIEINMAEGATAPQPSASGKTQKDALMASSQLG